VAPASVGISEQVIAEAYEESVGLTLASVMEPAVQRKIEPSEPLTMNQV
jgi:hypothetical protein